LTAISSPDGASPQAGVIVELIVCGRMSTPEVTPPADITRAE
jgi:hypothetical protein